MEKEADYLKKFIQQLDTIENPYEINQITEELVCSLLDAEFSSVWFYDKENVKLFRLRSGEFHNEISFEEKKGILYKCFMTQESSLYNYLASDKDYIASIDNPDNIKIKSKVMVPLIENKEFIGIVTAYNSIKKYDKFNHKKLKKLESLKPYIINAIYKMHSPQKFESSQKDLEVITPKEKKQLKKPDDTLNFVANLVHDIRTPANALYGFLDILEDQIKDDKLKNYVKNAKESASFINELTNSILNTVSAHQECDESEIKVIDTIHFFSSIAETFSSNMYKKNICFNIFIDPFLPKSIKIDALKLKRVILNLVGNAYKFTPNNKKVEFSVRYVAKTNKIVIYVKDTGVGIPKEKQKEIFKSFKQADEQTALEFGGNGLGLFISAKYVKELGGTLGVVSEVDIGSTFSFDIPVDAVEYKQVFLSRNNTSKIAIVLDKKDNNCATNIAKYMMRLGIDKENIFTCNSLEDIQADVSHIVVFESKVSFEQSKEYAKNGKKILFVEDKVFSIEKETDESSLLVISKYTFALYAIYKFLSKSQLPKVLIADDDAISVKLIEMILESEFCEIESVQNGQDALDKVLQGYKENQPYDYIYIDNKMPVIKGSDVMRHIREYELKNNIKRAIFAISTTGEKLDEFTSQLYDIYVGKPFRKEDIRSALQRK